MSPARSQVPPVESPVLTPEQAQALQALESRRLDGVLTPDEELEYRALRFAGAPGSDAGGRDGSGARS